MKSIRLKKTYWEREKAVKEWKKEKKKQTEGKNSNNFGDDEGIDIKKNSICLKKNYHGEMLGKQFFCWNGMEKQIGKRNIFRKIYNQISQEYSVQLYRLKLKEKKKMTIRIYWWLRSKGKNKLCLNKWHFEHRDECKIIFHEFSYADLLRRNKFVVSQVIRKGKY